MPKEKTAEQKITFVESGKVELTIRAPNLSPEKAQLIARDVRQTLQNCARLELLDEFVETIRVEYTELPVEAMFRIKWGDELSGIDDLPPKEGDMVIEDV